MTTAETKPRIRFTELKCDVLRVLAGQGGAVVDRKSGRATTRLQDLLGRTTNLTAMTAQISRMEEEGLITREVKGRRTYEIRAVDPSPEPRFQPIIDAAKKKAAEPEPGALARLHAAQADLDARKAADARELAERGQVVPAGLPTARAMMDEHDGHTVALPTVEVDASPEVEVQPFPSVDPINYDELAGRLLNRVLEVSSQDKRYVEAELERARVELGRARTDMRSAREEAQRFRTRLRDAEEELGRTKNLLVEARRAIRDRDANIDRLTSEHRKAVKAALSDHARRELERTMTEAPKHLGNGQ